MVDELTIGEAARQAGVNTSAIRYYERIGLLPRSKRVNKHRRLDPSVLHWLNLIQFARQAGFTLAEIELLLHGFEADTPPSQRWEELARRKLPELDTLIEQAQRMKQMIEATLACECASLAECSPESPQ
jgi:MerR family redox-sensitive transcriptional activator SoxR